MPLPHFFSGSLLLIKSSRFIRPLFQSSLAIWSFSSHKSCLLRSSSPWSMSQLKTKLVRLKANVFTTAPPIVNNKDAIFYQKWEAINPAPTIKSVITSFSSLRFLVSLYGLSRRTARWSFIDLFNILGVSSSGGATGYFLWPCLCPCLSQFSCLCCSLNFCCYILSSFLCLILNHLEAYICLCLLKNLLLITHVLTHPDKSQYRSQ